MSESRPNPNLATLAGFIPVVVGLGLTIGYLNRPGPWYAELHKPSFNPPDFVFPIAWLILYVLIGWAGARTWASSNSSAIAMWVAQLLLNFAWSPVFFGAHAVAAALAVIVALFASILGFIALQYRRDPAAAMLFLPYAVWVAFASALNFAILRLN